MKIGERTKKVSKRVQVPHINRKPVMLMIMMMIGTRLIGYTRTSRSTPPDGLENAFNGSSVAFRWSRALAVTVPIVVEAAGPAVHGIVRSGALLTAKDRPRCIAQVFLPAQASTVQNLLRHHVLTMGLPPFVSVNPDVSGGGLIGMFIITICSQVF